MARPRYQINPQDWYDCLDWLDHQLAQPTWLTERDHPVHSIGLSTLKDCLNQWRDVDRPTLDLCQSVQDILVRSLTMEDWGRLRKSLSARKRRRRETRLAEKPINITLTPSAHQMLVEYRDLSATGTLSEAVETAIQQALVELRESRERDLERELLEFLRHFKASVLIEVVQNYLELTTTRRSLANSCKIAHQLFLKRPDRNSLRLVRDRFVEDLVWNETHLKVPYASLNLFPDDLTLNNPPAVE